MATVFEVDVNGRVDHVAGSALQRWIVETVARIRSVPVGAVSDAPLEKPQILKGLEIEKDRYVTFEPGELAALRPKTSMELNVAEFVRLEEISWACANLSTLTPF